MKFKKDSFFIHIIANVVIVAAVGLLVLGSFAGMGVITASVSGNAIYRGNETQKRVTFMFNVYWGTEYIEGILDTLDAYNVKTTFFIGGSWADDNNTLLKEIVARGHEIGSHGYHHRDHSKLSIKENEQEIEVTGRLIKAVTGIEPSLFAPPSGAIGTNMFNVCESLGYKVIMWSKDTIDWRDKDSNLVYKRAVKNLQNGDLVLMHPTAHTLAALSDILKYVSDSGFKAVTVTENITEAY